MHQINKNSKGEISSRNVPVRFSSREKSSILDEHTVEQILSGNANNDTAKTSQENDEDNYVNTSDDSIIQNTGLI